jgi:hypothetical protein
MYESESQAASLLESKRSLSERHLELENKKKRKRRGF